MDLRDPGSLKTRDIVRVLALIFGFYVLLRLLWVAHPVVFLFFLGVLFGLPLAMGADWLEKRKVPRALGVTIILAAFIGLLTGAGVWMAPILRTQSRELQVRLPEAMDKIDAWLGHRANGVLGMLFNEESTADIAVDPALYHGGVLELVPLRERDRAAIALTRLATTLRRWLVTQLIAMLVIGTVTTVFLFTIHVKAALPLGILAGISKFIPIVGSIFAAIPAMAMAFIDSPHKALLVAIGYFVIQFVENHLLVPVLMKAGVNLPPAMTLGIQALMSVLFGFLGLLVAVPLLAAILTIVKTMNASELREISAEADVV